MNTEHKSIASGIGVDRHQEMVFCTLSGNFAASVSEPKRGSLFQLSHKICIFFLVSSVYTHVCVTRSSGPNSLSPPPPPSRLELDCALSVVIQRSDCGHQTKSQCLLTRSCSEVFMLSATSTSVCTDIMSYSTRQARPESTRYTMVHVLKFSGPRGKP